MKTTSSQKRVNLLLLMLLFGISIWAFSSTEKEYIYTEQTLIQEGASAEEIKEYNSLAKKLTSDNPGELIIKMKDIDRMNFIYDKMTVEQRSSAVALPKLPPPPPAPPVPGVSQKEMDEYNEIASRYQNSKTKIYKKEDYERMFNIKNRMSPKQKEGALKMPPPPPPPAKQKPTSFTYTLQKGLDESKIQDENYPQIVIDEKGHIEQQGRKMSMDSVIGVPKKNPPIIYVDGVLTKDYDLDKISPDQIESVTVLKNKSAIEKYGSKGKNGVILITTKVK